MHFFFNGFGYSMCCGLKLFREKNVKMDFLLDVCTFSEKLFFPQGKLNSVLHFSGFSHGIACLLENEAFRNLCFLRSVR